MLKDVLSAYAPKAVAAIKQSLQGISVTGKTMNSIRSEVTETHLTVYGRGFMEAVEKGRGPRKNATYGEFDKHLEEWLQAKGFPSKKTKKGTTYYQLGQQWFSAKSLAWKINKDGDKLFKSGQTRDVYTTVVEKFLEELKAALAADQKQEFKKKVLESVKA